MQVPFVDNARFVKYKVLAVVASLALTVGAVGAVAVLQMQTLAEGSKRMYHDAAQPMAKLKEVSEGVALVRVRTSNLNLAKNAEQRLEAETRLGDERRLVTKALEEYASDRPSSSLTEKFRSDWSDIEALLDGQLLPAERAGDMATFESVRTTRFIPAAEKLRETSDKLLAEDLARAEKLQREANRNSSIAIIVLVVTAVAGLALALTLAQAIATGISRSLAVAVDGLGRIAEGDLTVELTAQGRDEVAQISEATNRMVIRLRQTIRAIADSGLTLSTASEELSSIAAQMRASAAETATQAGTVSVAAEQVSANVQTVAAGSEQMTASISEIATNTAEAARVAVMAVAVAEGTDATVNELGSHSAEIGEIVEVIASIANQTNLLALNATIEAARAGEAGKGFAVVANEVKELAKQTAVATQQIGGRVSATQESASRAVGAIAQIAAVIKQIDELQGGIASAIEEQTATTNEISRNVTDASTGVNEIAGNVNLVANAADETTRAVDTTLVSAGELARLASQLNDLVGQFSLNNDERPTSRPSINASAPEVHLIDRSDHDHVAIL